MIYYIKENYIQEKIYGLLGFAYHRTDEIGLKAILNNKFLPGGGDAYGRGAYLTYELESQLRSNMVNNYGEYIVKFKVNLDKVLIFDKNIQKIVYGKEMKIIDQISYFKLGKYFDNKIKDYFFDYNTKFTSVGARDFYDKFKFIPKILNGLLFTGKNDGLVLVMYNTNNMHPISYCFSDENKLNEKDLEWNKSLDKNLIKSYMLSVTSGSKDILQYYDYYEKVDNGFIKIQKKDKWGLLDKNFKEVIKPIYDAMDLYNLDKGFIKVLLNNKWGLLDKNFKEVVKPIYDDIDFYHYKRTGLIKVKLKDGYGLLDKNFNEIVKPIYYDIEIISRNKIKVQENSYVFKKIIINLNHNNSEEIIN